MCVEVSTQQTYARLPETLNPFSPVHACGGGARQLSKSWHGVPVPGLFGQFYYSVVQEDEAKFESRLRLETLHFRSWIALGAPIVGCLHYITIVLSFGLVCLRRMFHKTGRGRCEPSGLTNRLQRGYESMSCEEHCKDASYSLVASSSLFFT